MEQVTVVWCRAVSGWEVQKKKNKTKKSHKRKKKSYQDVMLTCFVLEGSVR